MLRCQGVRYPKCIGHVKGNEPLFLEIASRFSSNPLTLEQSMDWRRALGFHAAQYSERFFAFPHPLFPSSFIAKASCTLLYSASRKLVEGRRKVFAPSLNRVFSLTREVFEGTLNTMTLRTSFFLQHLGENLGTR